MHVDQRGARAGGASRGALSGCVRLTVGVAPERRPVLNVTRPTAALTVQVFSGPGASVGER
ncbi:hypothetical protein [Myxococcus sp. CA039A]|uniref:hypothetical protein n=1 Tax=Myxococcus sp. CA039A TaxID=2741737 RepID=UPI00157B5724|nr:hypothetical protein [Myxococcus sp. CA039A]NTX35193.1 hypothetical protein [Myxococcus sp. CA033]NTX51198.1 hypothetical protein [Myxococcus sp. CA039A]